MCGQKTVCLWGKAIIKCYFIPKLLVDEPNLRNNEVVIYL